jgi:prepilin-type N-terminal cleavage/methylation domain-containing protein
MSPRGREDGFTLVELLVAVALMLLVFGAVLTVFETFLRDNRYGQLRNETQDNARSAIDRLARELRSVAAPTTKAAGAVEVAEGSVLTFETVDASKTTSGLNTANTMRVRYCLDNSNPANEVLWRQWLRWTTATAPAAPTTKACPDTAAGDFEGKQKVVEHVVNRIGGRKRRVFSYGPAGATQVAEITSVQPVLYIDPFPGSRPGETEIRSAISFRNENRLPAASFSAVEVSASRNVILNAAESTDPDGLALTYAWWDNGVRLEATSQSVELKSLTLNSTHTFKLEVTDPAGLSSKAERTLVIK